MFPKKSSGTQLYDLQRQITKLRLQIQDLEQDKKGHLKKIDVINGKIDALRYELQKINC